ncbi:MAG TPA: NYN domain-containing protein [Candidatus Limnocylindrales bacterium]|nr:NYN domain-containing protein [Candidatus Limnocylindrales bacterium]
MGKNVAVFVDVANIFYAAKAAGVDIDYVTLLKSAGAGRDLVRAYAYTGLDPDNENQRNFHDFLRRHGYKVVSKDIRKYGDGKVKANLDIELVVDMMKTARNLDIAIVVSGDGDFAPAIRAVQEMGVRVEVISFRGNTSSDLIEVADQFTDITQLARVEKGTRSGRRVADDDADLSMTEVPDKQTEGSGVGRGARGGRGRGRGRSGDAEPVAASATGSSRRRGGASTNGASKVAALPGERLRGRSGEFSEADLASAEVFTLDDLDETAAAGDVGEGTAAADGQTEEARDENGRRRRRRGGRGRGRGRGREEIAASSPSRPPVDRFEPDEEEDEEPVEAPRPRSTPFGSVWDSQLGTTAAPAPLSSATDDEDFDEPEIPEYLIAEQRRGRGGPAQRGARGPRGGRSAYQSAIERERYGRGRSGGINRYPDVSGRTGGNQRSGGRGFERDERPREAPRRSGSAEPWSEVPPELEAMLRAQVSQQPPRATEAPASPAEATDEIGVIGAEAPEAEAAAPKRRTTRSSTTRGRAAATTDAGEAETAAPKRRTTRKTAATAEGAEPATAEGAEAPKRRTTRKKATAADTSADAGADAGVETGAEPAADEAAVAPKRRTTRRTSKTAS